MIEPPVAKAAFERVTHRRPLPIQLTPMTIDDSPPLTPVPPVPPVPLVLPDQPRLQLQLQIYPKFLVYPKPLRSTMVTMALEMGLGKLLEVLRGRSLR